MNKEEAIRNFVRRNYKLLRDKETFDRKRYKDIKKVYFGKELRFQFGNPRDKEICKCFVEDFLIKIQRISDKETLEQIISETPFLKTNNIKADDYVALIDLTIKKYAIKEEIQGLQEVEKHEKLIELVEREHAKEIDDLILQKKEEYRRLPSILDDVDFDEPEELPKEDETKEWWEELKLRENPFPGPLDGFSLINKSLYDEIIVETQPIQWALNKVKKEQVDFFHKGFLLDGDFGTGKTTFFDFMAPHLTINHIEPIRIALSENISEAHYVQKFEKEMCIEIVKLAEKYNLSRTSRIIDFEEARLLMLKIQDSGAKGFFVFIDDLHKHIDSNRVFNFLANLQITKNNFSRDGINVAFVVAGFQSWRDKIRQNSALTGFFDAADELTLPEVTPELAAQTIKKRLQAFSINPEKELTVKEEFLKTIFKKVSSEIGHPNIGFRPYIQAAVKNFEEKKFDILSLDFTKLDETIMQEIKLTLEANDDFKKSMDKFVFGGGIKKKEVREMALKVLCEIYLRKGVSEDEEIFGKNKFSFKQLIECGLIQKYDRNGKLVWKVSPFLDELNKKNITQFNLSMEDYLVSIYYSTTTSKVKEKKSEQNKIEICEQDLREWKGKLEPSVLENLTIALQLYSKNIFPFTETSTKKLDSLNSLPELEKIKETIWMMMKCIIRFESPLLLDGTGKSDISGWTLRHRTLEYSQHFISMEQNLEKGNPEKADITRLISFANDAFGELWSEFKESMNIYQSGYVKCYEIPRKVLKTIYSEYNNLFTITKPREEYFNSLNEFVGTIEDTIRQYFLVSCTLIFGPYHVRSKYYPENIKKYITKIVPSSSSSSESYNEFENLNRGQYRDLFTQIGKSSEFYRFIIKPLIEKWDSQDIESFFECFGDLNISTSHRKKISVDDRKKDIPTFFRMSCRLISAISTRLKDLVMLNNTILCANDKTFVVFGYLSKRHGEVRRIVPIEEASDVSGAIYHHEITSALLNKGINKIMETSDNAFGSIELDLLDIEETRIKFNMNYCESIPLISNFLTNNKIRVIPLYGTNICLLSLKTKGEENNMSVQTPDVEPKKEKLNIFKLGNLWCFKYFFDDQETFKELSEYYNQEKYRFELGTVEERNKVMKYLEEKDFEPVLIEDTSDYTVKIGMFKKYATILKNSIDYEEKGKERTFIMKDLASVEEAIEKGAEKYPGNLL